MNLWAWLRCLTYGHRLQWVAEQRQGTSWLVTRRCKRCGRYTETKGEVLALQPGDVLAITCPDNLTEGQRQAMEKLGESILPHNIKCLVLHSGAQYGIIRPALDVLALGVSDDRIRKIVKEEMDRRFPRISPITGMPR